MASGRLNPRSGICAIALLLLAAVTVPSTASAQDGSRLLQQPTVSSDHVAFVYAHDLWIVDRAGGDARRLTSSTGRETNPHFSPDGQWIAYSAQYEGNTDVYVVPASGGIAKRLTWHPGRDVVCGWHPDGTKVLFGSRRASSAPVGQLFTVSTNGGLPTPLEIPRAAFGSFDADASRVAYNPYYDAFRTWKRYRGGRVSRVWVFDRETQETVQVPHDGSNDAWPCWIDGNVYFASDRRGIMNIWKSEGGTAKPQQVTPFNTFDVRNLSAGAGVLAIEQGGRIHIYDPRTARLETPKIRLVHDGLAAQPRWEAVKGSVRSASIAPNGKRAVFEARGEIITVPREKGDARMITRSPGAHDRNPAWSPDGEQIAWFTDESGEYQLAISDRLGRERVRTYDLGDGGFYTGLSWSPTGDHILVSDKRNRLRILDIESGKFTLVAKNQGSLGVIFADTSWSPDGQWIAFESRNPTTLYDRIALYSVSDGSTTLVTDSFAESSHPAFSKDGKYLYFVASIEEGPQRFGLDMETSASRSSEGSLYLAVLDTRTPNPFSPESDDAVKASESSDEDEDEDEDKKDDGDDSDESGDEAEKDDDAASDEGSVDEDSAEDKEEKSDLPPTVIALEDLDQRVLALPLSTGRYGGLAASKKGLLFTESTDTGTHLKEFLMEDREAKTRTESIRGFEVSHDGESVLIAAGSRWKINALYGKDSKNLDIDSVKIRLDPPSEWAQILREAWRIHRDYFYDPNFHGVDWPAMWERWSAFLPHVRHRAELDLLLREMTGELACGHNYVSGGDYPDGPEGVSVGLLGADYEVRDGRYQITNIYRGQNWNPTMRAPLTAPGVDVEEGDYLLSVGGRELTADQNIFELFANTAGTQVEVQVSKDPEGSDSRTTMVVPIGSDAGLRRQSWIETNRARVEEMSGGRLGYIYLPDTGNRGRRSFDRDFYSQLDKEGLVIDERFNGGGKVADYIVHVLSREPLCYWGNREQWIARTPFSSFDGPKVMVINERAGSGGDALPWLFKQQGLGELVGTRTWGGLVGISGYPSLMDGGRVTSASFGVMDRNGDWAVENVGIPPDFEVFQTPKAVIAGGDPQLEKAIELCMQKLERGETGAKPPTELKTPTPR